MTESGVSPRGIPGYGDGLVGVDSDEHDEEAHITEDLDLRTKMVDKRLKKLTSIQNEALAPTLVGAKDYKSLVIGWGSTYNALLEALRKVGRQDVSVLHFKQVYPLHSGTKDYLLRAEKTIVVENNATSQFGRLLRLQTGITIGEKILKYSGIPFSDEELAEKIRKSL